MSRRTCAVLFAMLAGFALPTERALAEGPAGPGFVDLHVDLSYQVSYKDRDVTRGSGQLLAAELQRVGVSGVVLPLYIPHEVSPDGPRLEDLERSYQQIYALLGRTEPYALPGTVPGARPVRTWLAFEGAAPLAGRPEEVAKWVARGVRSFGLVHVHDNALASSSGPSPALPQPSYGLTPAGKELVTRVFALGAVIDVSHASDRAVDDVLALARAQRGVVIATHSNARAIANHSRNLDDERLRAIAATGGVVGVNFHAPYLAVGRRATLDDVVRHVRHLITVMGPDHVAVGSDFEGGILAVAGLEDIRGLPRLASALKANGVDAVTLPKVFGQNALRVLEPSQ